MSKKAQVRVSGLTNKKQILSVPKKTSIGMGPNVKTGNKGGGNQGSKPSKTYRKPRVGQGR